jgi:thiol-disulfide isomerase/thioredoxin
MYVFFKIIKGFNYMKVSKLLTITAIMILATSLMSACSEDKTEEVKSQTQLAMTNSTASVNEATKTESTENQTETKVYTITSVGTPESGKAVDFKWQENGKEISFAELTKNKVVLINFWGTWCPPCRMEIPDLVKLHNELKDKDFVMIGIALERNPSSALQKVTGFAKAQKMSYYLFIPQSNDIISAYGGINAVPTTFIIDKNGKIAETIVGMRNFNTFLEAVKRVL